MATIPPGSPPSMSSMPPAGPPPGLPPMPPPGSGRGPMRPRHSFMGPIILICIGVFFLVVNLVPTLDPWTILSRYWPVILILFGLAKVWDYYAAQRYAGSSAGEVSGVMIAVVLLICLLALAFWRSGRRTANYNTQHSAQSVELQGATAVTANLNIPAGELHVSGGSAHLMDANFDYDSSSQAPRVDYSVNGNQGQLNVTEGGGDVHFGPGDDRWDLQFNDAVPLDLTLQMGAGQSDLRFADVDLTHLQVHVGAGEVTLDLTGPRKQNLSAEIQGGVGQARIRLPKDVGVKAHASGGIGSVNVHGLTKEGDEYVNAAYGKAPTTIDLNVQGGIGEIDLDQE